MIEHVVDEWCEGCIHRGQVNGGNDFWCDYIGDTDRMRGCPAGTGCTKREYGVRNTDFLREFVY